MRRPGVRSIALRQAAVAGLLALAATACATGYRSSGLGGGYSDDRLDDSHYLVRFDGNGYASRERVWHFWFHRCAELTLEKGFAFFDLESAGKGEAGWSSLQELAGAERLAERRPASPRGLVVPAGRTVYTYVPSTTTVTTWHTRAIVAMYAAVPPGRALLDARRVIELLGSYVKSDAAETPPERKVLMRGTLVRRGRDGAAARLFPDGARVGYVDLRRVLAGVAEGKAAVARIKASFAERQGELDAGKEELEGLRAARDAEPAPARKGALASELETRARALREARDRFQAELDAAEKAAVRQVLERALPVVERARVTYQLDAVATEDVASGLSDGDVTSDVIRLYDQQHPVPDAS